VSEKVSVSAKKTISICSYNIHKGMCATNNTPVLLPLREIIRADNADIVCLQEVAGESPRSHFDLPQFEYLADQVWPHYAYGRNAIYQSGDHGNAILSKHPFEEWSNVDVSRWWFSQRGILLGRLTTGLYIACAHFGLFAVERNRQLQQLLALIEKQVPKSAGLIVAGDFNDWTGALHKNISANTDFREAHFELHGRLAKTFPARRPVFPMDRIYYRNLELTDARVLGDQHRKMLSDHRAIFASFELG